MQQPQQRPQATRLVYGMTNEVAEAADTAVEGKLFVCDYEARVLFDPRPTHSFIARNFAMTIGRRPE